MTAAVAMTQGDVAPRDRTDTMPSGLPERTLGWGVIAWIHDNLLHVDGPKAGTPFSLTQRQVLFLLWFYAIDENGNWLFLRGVRRLAKGSGKSPFAAVHAIVELLGPVRLERFDDQAPGKCVGRPEGMPLVQIAATSESQTANTMRQIRAMTHKRTLVYRRYQLDIGKTYIDTPTGGRLEQIASSAGSAEGAMVTFAIGDETEHWTPGQGGPKLMATLTRNAAKTGNRIVETSNAWTPGSGSVAEATFDAWCDQQEGKTRGSQGILYDAVVAPANTALTDSPAEGMISLQAALEYVYEDCPWVPIPGIKEQIWQPNNAVSESRAYYLNQPTAADTSWIAPHQWAALADSGRSLEDGEEIVLFFDGSKSQDHTALVGCCMSDGHVFTAGVWDPADMGGTMDTDVVDGLLSELRERFKVIAFWADVREFESYVHTSWPELFSKDKLIPASSGNRKYALVAWDMRSHSREFSEACELARDEILNRDFTHDGDWVLSQHVANARAYESRGYFAIRKESQKSPRKIDAAVCMIGARMMYRYVREHPDYKKRHRTSRVRVQSGWGAFG